MKTQKFLALNPVFQSVHFCVQNELKFTYVLLHIPKIFRGYISRPLQKWGERGKNRRRRKKG
jgi:hypothetical protein